MQLLKLWGQYLPGYLRGTETTAALTVLALAVSVALGFLTALARGSRVGPLKGLATIYIELIRATPVVVVIFIAYYGLGGLGIRLPGFVAAVAALGVFYATLYGEIIRGGIESVPSGQREAAMALGLAGRAVLLRVVLPQALLAMLPPATNALSDLLKDTSLVVTIAVSDLMYHAYNAISVTFLPMDMLVLAGVIYFVLNYLLSHVIRRWEYSFIQR